MTEVPINVRHEELTKLNNKFTESPSQKRRKRIISHVHVILISHVYISIFMGVSNVWKSHSGSLTLSYITDMFHKYRSRSFKVFCKNGVLDSSQESIYVGVSY